MGQGSFYPHGKPARFSYTKHFVEEYGYDTGYLAKENTLYPGLDGEDNSYIIDRALKNLDILRQEDETIVIVNRWRTHIKNPYRKEGLFRC